MVQADSGLQPGMLGNGSFPFHLQDPQGDSKEFWLFHQGELPGNLPAPAREKLISFGSGQGLYSRQEGREAFGAVSTFSGCLVSGGSEKLHSADKGKVGKGSPFPRYRIETWGDQAPWHDPALLQS